ncbi:MAG: carbon-nitrogen hydrolase family protein [Defluviitaleaceae bacterium]|nr:carbon-nitrogen hydrolase family protein [Defluviitaleaceae bacterium]
MPTVKVATTCIKLRLGSKSKNLTHILELIEKTVAQTNPDIVLLSESVFTRLNPGAIDNFSDIGMAEATDGPIFTALKAAAQKHGIHLIFNINAPYGNDGPQGIFNSNFIIDPLGEIVGRYDKNMIPPGEVKMGIQTAHNRPVFTLNINGRDVVVGMMICYDVAFADRDDHPFSPGSERIVKSFTDQGTQIIFNSTIGDYMLESICEAKKYGVWFVVAGQDEYVWDKPERGFPMGVSGIIDPTGTPKLLFSDRTANAKLSAEDMAFRCGDGSFGCYEICL